MLKDSSRSRLSSKSTGISRKMETENTIEKRLRVFRAHSLIGGLHRRHVGGQNKRKCVHSLHENGS